MTELEKAIKTLEAFIDSAYASGLVQNMQSSSVLNGCWTLIKDSTNQPNKQT